MTNPQGRANTQTVGLVTRHLKGLGLDIHRLRLYDKQGDIGGLDAIVYVKGKEAETFTDDQLEEWLSVAEMKAHAYDKHHVAVVLKRKHMQNVEQWWVATREETFTGTFTVLHYFKDWARRLANGEFDRP